MSRHLDLERQDKTYRAGWSEPTSYDADFHRWTQEQAAFLKDGEWSKLDIANLADEVESLGRSEKNEIRSRLTVLVQHLLKWKYQTDGRSNSWRGTIVEQRKRLVQQLKENPSLKRFPESVLAEQHEIARIKAAGETGPRDDVFPVQCPFAIEQILDESFYPGGEGMGEVS